MRFATLAAAAALLVAAPALADVRAGVEAWQRGDYRVAVDQWRGPAVAGDADAQFNLGQAYKLGRGVPVDPQLAESWFGKAARQGHEQAEDNYALALFQGGRRAEALPWLAKSTARDEPRTELVLGTMLFNGDGVPRDYPRAYALMTRAATPRAGSEGLASARETLAQMDGYVSPTDRERGVAMAQQIALTASQRPAPPAGPMRVSEQAPVADIPAPVRPSGKPPRASRPTVVAAPPPRPVSPVLSRSTPRPVPVAAAPVAKGGNWKVQLGAFRSRANAEKLWGQVHGRLAGAQPGYIAAGPVTRLIATGFANKAAAQAACARVGGGCIVVAP